MMATANSLKIFYGMIIFYTVGMLTSVIQKMTIYKVNDNVMMNYSAVIIELSGSILGVLFIIIYN